MCSVTWHLVKNGGDAYLGGGAPKEKASPALHVCIGHGRSAEASRKGMRVCLAVWKKAWAKRACLAFGRFGLWGAPVAGRGKA
jgi:hypothetical protein